MYEIFMQLLQEHKVTPYKVSKETGISQTTLAHWKSGRSAPKQDKLKKIADYFGVSVDYLMTGSDAQPQKPEVSEEDIKVALFGGDEEVTDEDWNQVKNFVDFIKSTKKK